MRADPGTVPWWGVFGPGVAVGLLLGSTVAANTGDLVAALVLMAVGGAVLVGAVAAGAVVRVQRYQRLVGGIEVASTQLVSGAVVGTPVVAQVMRWRARGGGPAFLAGTPFPIGTPPILVLATLPDDDGPRWVAGAVPVLQAGVRSQQALGFLLHPTEPVVVLDPRISPAYVAATVADPRWAHGTDWTRGFLPNLLASVGALVGGVAVGGVVAVLVALVA